jgi:hypothetical protein
MLPERKVMCQECGIRLRVHFKGSSQNVWRNVPQGVRTPSPSDCFLITFHLNHVLEIMLQCSMGANFDVSGVWDSLAIQFLQRVISECLGECTSRRQGPGSLGMFPDPIEPKSGSQNHAPTLHVDVHILFATSMSALASFEITSHVRAAQV